MKNYIKISCVALSLAAFQAPAFAQVEFGFNNKGSKGSKEYGPDKEKKTVLNPYDPKYRPDLSAKTDEDVKPSLVPNFIFKTDFIRRPNAAADDLDLLLSTPGFVTGCLTKTEPVLEIKKAGSTLKIKVTEGEIGADNYTTRYYHYECQPSVGRSEIYATLSKQQLLTDGIKKLEFEGDKIGKFNEAKIDIGRYKTTIEMKGADLSRFGLDDIRPPTTITHWDFPENTLVITASGADLRDENTMASAIDVATSKGLSILNTVIPNFKTDFKNSNKLYVVDSNARYADQFETTDDYIEIGKMILPEQQFGASGSYTGKTQKTLFARRPSLTD